MKRMKKLIAALMAVAMIASLNISAFATPYTNVEGFNAVADFAKGDVSTSSTTNKVIGSSSVTGATTSDATASIYAGSRENGYGYVTGQFSSEGKMPEGTVNIVMPTVSTTESPFNMILDPNDLIGQSVTKRIEGITANTSYVYFANVNDGTTTYSNTSSPLTIYNKGTWPLSVKLTAELTKGDRVEEGSLIQMVGATNDLSAQANKNIPSMYMAVTPSSGAAVIVKDGYGVPSIKVTGNDKLVDSTPIFAFNETETVKVLSRDKKAFSLAFDKKAILLTATSGAISAKLQDLSGNTPADWDGVDSVSGYTFSIKDATALKGKVTTGTGETASVLAETIEIQYKKSSDASATPKTIATVKVTYDPVVMSQTDASTTKTSTLAFTKSTAASSATTAAIAVEAQANAYQVTYKDAANGYVKEMTEAAAGQELTAWPKLSFTLTAAINKSTAWDDLNETTIPHAVDATNKAIKTLQTKVIWDVQNNYNGDDSVNTPKLKVTKFANVAKDEVGFKVYFGKGSDAIVAVQSVTVGTGTSAKVYVASTSNAAGKIATVLKTDKLNAVTDGTAFVFEADAAAITAQSGTLNYLKADQSIGHINFTFYKADV